MQLSTLRALEIEVDINTEREDGEISQSLTQMNSMLVQVLGSLEKLTGQILETSPVENRTNQVICPK